ncbi:MAG: substrate-binding domain-containing protein, partial [Geminicoccaceae bacterium]
MRFNIKSAKALGRRRCLRQLACCLIIAKSALIPNVGHGREPLFLGVTTSTENSGLLAHLVEAFEADHGISIRAVTAGSGAVLNLAARGDVDVVLVHSPEDEEAFIAAGYGTDRRPVMHNRFVIVGPTVDPAGISDARDAAAALKAIAMDGALFLSRGDESGTHKA